ncbi:septum formation initiator family protein [Phycicoccus sp. Root101]|uniref:FtsB family cell division protein n=1 Tax=Phycicoccus sp. Root101 TaxID=1736421 RepID=UPI0009EBBAEA|nr:septum formation initiator family protein [Phycicoccus sp. Root101]
MAGTGHGTRGSGKPARRPAAPRAGATARNTTRGTSARPGAGPGRSRATASGAVRKAASAQVATERKASRTVLRGVVLATILVLLAVTLVPTLRSYLRQQGEIDALNEGVGQQRTEVTALQKEQARWNDDVYVVQQARERLKFVKVGEKSYTVIDGQPSAKALPGVAKAPAASSDHPWYGQLWESVRVADAGPAANTASVSAKK